MLYLCTGTAQAFLSIMEKLRLAIPQAREVWEHSTLFQGLQGKFNEILGREKTLRESIASGQLKMKSVLGGTELKPVK